MKRLGLIVTLLMSLVAAPLAVAEPASNDMAVRIELHAINTMTLSDAQFLTGDANGKASDHRTIADRRRLGPPASRRASTWLRWHGRQY